MHPVLIWIQIVVQSLSGVPRFVHTKLPCPSLSSSRWCHPTISSSVTPFSSCPQSFPASGSLPMSLLSVHIGGQSIGASASVLPVISGVDSFRMDWLDLLAVCGTLKSLLQHHSLKASVLRHSAFFMVHVSHLDMTTRKAIALSRRTFVGKVNSDTVDQ